MNHRVPVLCDSCRTALTLRFVVEGARQPFVFACPHCDTELRGVFSATPDPMGFNTESEDVTLLKCEDAAAVSVAIATTLPVHRALIGATGVASTASPFLTVVQAVGDRKVIPLMERVDRLRAVREHLIPLGRRAATRWASNDDAGLRRTMEGSPWHEEIDWTRHTPDELLESLLSAIYQPLGGDDGREARAKELLQLCDQALHRDPVALRELFRDFETGPLREHRRRLVEVVFAVLDDIDALIPALMAEAMLDAGVHVDDYRVMRDDFAQRRGAYQDLFELGSRNLAFLAPVINLASRGDYRAYVDGRRRSPHKARRARAAEREAWTADLPAASVLHDAVSRHTRNDIGHTLARLDVARGCIVYEGGKEQNYILFLVDMLQAVRLSRYLFDSVQILDRLRERT